MVPRVSTSRFYSQQEISRFSCFQTLSAFKEFCCFAYFRHFSYSKDFSVFPVSRHFLYPKDFAVVLFLDTFPFEKCLETGKTTKSVEKIIIFKGFCHFSCLQTLSVFKSVLKQKNDQIPLEINIFKGFSCFQTHLITKKCQET